MVMHIVYVVPKENWTINKVTNTHAILNLMAVVLMYFT